MNLPVYTHDWISAFLPYGGPGPSFGFPDGDATTQIGDWGYYWGSIYLGTMASLSIGPNMQPDLGTAEEAFNRRYPDPDNPAPPSLPVVSNQPPQMQQEWPSAFEQVQTCAAMAPLYSVVPGLTETADMSPVGQERGSNETFPLNPEGNSQGNAIGGGVALLGVWAACSGLQAPH